MLGCFHAINSENQEKANINLHISFTGRNIANDNSIFSSSPTYFIRTLRISKVVITQIDKYIKHCL
jgi:hypothetical protein